MINERKKGFRIKSVKSIKPNPFFGGLEDFEKEVVTAKKVHSKRDEKGTKLWLVKEGIKRGLEKVDIYSKLKSQEATYLSTDTLYKMALAGLTKEEKEKINTREKEKDSFEKGKSFDEKNVNLGVARVMATVITQLVTSGILDRIYIKRDESGNVVKDENGGIIITTKRQRDKQKADGYRIQASKYEDFLKYFHFTDDEIKNKTKEDKEIIDDMLKGKSSSKKTAKTKKHKK